MAPSARLFAALAKRSRESARRRRSRDLKVESLEPRLALATGLLSTLVSIRDESGQKLLAPGATADIAEGEQLTASVRLTRKPDSAIMVSFKSLAPLEVAAPPTTLRFTKANWNQPQTVSFGSHQDNVRDGDHLVPVKVITAVARNPQRQAARKVWIESLDSGVVAAATPVTATQRGSLSGGGASGSVVGTYDAVTNRGTATLTVTMPTLNKVRDRVITVGYSLGVDNRVQIESLAGITASRFRWDATYRDVGNDRGLFGTVTVLQPRLGKSATAMMTAAAVPEAVQNLAATATGVGSLLLSWNAPPGGATSYTVTMTTGTGSSTQTQVTTNTSLAYTGLSPANSYAFSVTASNASGTGIAAQASFGVSPLAVGLNPAGLTTGLDGSIWVANLYSNNVQQIVKENGAWTAKPGIGVGTNPYGLTTGLDGSIWVSNYGRDSERNKSGTVQQIANVDGVWRAQPAITVGRKPAGLATGRDGSIWVANYSSNTVQQIVKTNGTWQAQDAIDIGNSPIALSAALDGSIWVLTRSNIRQIKEVNGAWTPQDPQSIGSNREVASPSAYAVATGLDGSIWFGNKDATVNRISSLFNPSNDVTDVVSVVDEPSSFSGEGGKTEWQWYPPPVKPGLDGSIWVAEAVTSTVQNVTESNGVWTAQPTINVGIAPNGLTTSADGSIWVANFGTQTYGEKVAGTVSQIIAPPNAPTALAAVFGPKPGTMKLGWLPPEIDGGSSIIEYTATVHQGDYSKTITTTGSSCEFDGLTYGGGNTYFTVTATNFAGASSVAHLLIDADGNPMAIGTSGLGISTNGTAFSGGGFDGTGNTYSWEAMGDASAGGALVGSSLVSGSLSFDLDDPNMPDFTWAAGQTLAVPGTGSVLTLAAAAVGGSQVDQQLILNFTDGSTATWTQSFSDWLSPQHYSGERFLSTQSYYNTASGGQSSTANYVYGYGYSLPTGKTLESVTLPNNSLVRILGVAVSEAIEAYTGKGISTDGTQVFNGGFDGTGNTYSWEAMGDASAGGALVGSSLVSGSLSFDLGDPNMPDFTWAAGQTLAVPGSGSVLTLAAAAVFGSQAGQSIVLNFTDGSTATWIQSLSDWCSPQNYPNESILSTQSYRNTETGGQNNTTNYVYSYGYTLPAGKTLQSITLPNNPNVRILGATLTQASATVDLTWNAYGLVVGNNQVPNSQGFDGHGNYYNINNGTTLGLGIGGPNEKNFAYRQITWGGATFNLGPAPSNYSQSNNRDGNDNFLQAQGQTLAAYSAGYTNLLLIGAGANGTQPKQQFTMKFSDGSTSTWVQSFTDWRNSNGSNNNPPPSGSALASANESLVAVTNLVNQVGNTQSKQDVFVYGYNYAIPAGKTLVSVTLPRNGNVGILGVALA